MKLGLKNLKMELDDKLGEQLYEAYLRVIVQAAG